MDGSLQNEFNKKVINFPVGFENLSIEDKQKFFDEQLKESESQQVLEQKPSPEQIKSAPEPEYYSNVSVDPELRSRLNTFGIEVETDMYLISDIGVKYDEQDRVLKIRPRVKPEIINNYIAEILLPKLELPKEPKVVEAVVENVPEWQKGEEWQNFEKLRTAKAGIENDFKKGIHSQEYLDEIRANYENARDVLAAKIHQILNKASEDGLILDQGVELNSKINDIIFDELVKKENDEYLNALRADRGETWKDKAKEVAKSTLSSAAFKWYLSQNKFVRIGLTTLLATGIGYGIGTVAAAGAVGYAGARLARGVISLEGAAVGRAIGSKVKGWDIETINQWEKRKELEIKDSGGSLEEKSRELQGVKEKADKERRRRALKKSALTIGFGAGAGLLAGISEHFVVDPRGSSVTDQINQPEAPEVPTTEVPQEVPETGMAVPAQDVPKEVAEVLHSPDVSEPTEVTATPEVEKIFADPIVLKHEVVAGDSTWKILKGTLENNDQFKGMTEAQKTYVLSALANKVIKNPSGYGFGDNGTLNVGDQTDFTKLFEDAKEIKSILNKAKQTIVAGSPQEVSILQNNAKIASWVEEHPNGSLTEDKVSEILSGKPKLKVEIIDKDRLAREGRLLESEPESGLEPKVVEVEKSPDVPNTSNIPNSDLQKQVENEILTAKGRLNVLEKDKENVEGLRTMAGDISGGQEVEKAFRMAVNSIYGKKGLLGMGRIEGVNTKDWEFMAKLPATKVVEYYMHDSTKSGFSPDVVGVLSKSKTHNALMKEMVDLMGKEAKGAVRPLENENMENFLKRLGGYVLKTNLQKIA